MSLCTPIGEVLVDYRRLVDESAVPTWVPDTPISDDEDAWHPLDAVIAPLRTSRSGLLGTLSVDLPRDGRRPGPAQLELLEMYAAQASVAIENAALHTALVTRDAEREQTLGRLTAVLGEVPAAIVELDLDGRIRTWNPAAQDMFGWSAEEVIGGVNPTVDAVGYQAGLAELARGEVVHRQLAQRRRKDGNLLDVEMSSAVLKDAEGKPFGYIGVLSDVTDRVTLERELRHAAVHDPLTGLPNRVLLRERLQAAAAAGAEVSLLLLDLDGFKAVNDTLGHGVGDEVLLEVSRRLARSCRPADLLVRLGGDEFVALVQGDSERAVALADRFLKILAEPISRGDREIALGCSIGIASPSEHGGDSALRDADIAMYVAKSQGKGRYQIFAPALRNAVLDRTTLSEDLRSALTSEQLSLRYHPVIDVRTRAVVAFEALLRWEHPTRGELSPLQFIPLAEESGLIEEIGDWVMREACAEMARVRDLLPADREMAVTVNLSAVQLQATDLVSRVQQILHDAGLEPRQLVLELTESVLVDDVSQASEVFGRLRTAGVRLAMDDFGAGYSSLRYLRRLPFDIIKLDKGLTEGIDRDPSALALLDAVLGLLNRLGLRTCAEGIETAGQLAAVESLGCELGQGFLVSQPLRADALHALLLSGWDALALPGPREGSAPVRPRR